MRGAGFEDFTGISRDADDGARTMCGASRIRRRFADPDVDAETADRAVPAARDSPGKLVSRVNWRLGMIFVGLMSGAGVARALRLRR